MHRTSGGCKGHAKILVLWSAGLVLGLVLFSCSQGEKGPRGVSPQTQDPVPVASNTSGHDGPPRPQLASRPSEPPTFSQAPRNRLPKVLSVGMDPPDRVYRGQDIRAVPQGMDPDGDAVTYEYQWVVNGVVYPQDESPVLRGDQFKRGDEVTVKVIPFDREGAGELYKPLPITIPNAPPKITSNPPMVFRSQTYTYQVTAEDADGDPITFSLASNPEGMKIDPKSGMIQWNIGRQQSGEHGIEVVAEDAFGGRSFQRYGLTIAIP